MPSVRAPNDMPGAITQRQPEDKLWQWLLHLEIYTQKQFLAHDCGADRRECLGIQEIDTCGKRLQRTGAGMKPTFIIAVLLYREFGILPVGNHCIVVIDDFIGITILQDGAFIEKDNPVTQSTHVAQAVGYEENRCALRLELPDTIETFVLEIAVADRKYLVDDKDVRARFAVASANAKRAIIPLE